MQFLTKSLLAAVSMVLSLASSAGTDGIGFVALPQNPHALDQNRACGPYCLTLLNSMLGGDDTYESIVELCPPGPQGVNLNDIKQAAELIGLSARGVNANLYQLKQLPYAAIVHLHHEEQLDHFVAWIRWDAERHKVLMFSPPGRLEYEDEKVLQNYSGVALLLSDKPIPEALFVESRWAIVSRWAMWITFFTLVVVLLKMVRAPRGIMSTRAAQQAALLALCIVFVSGGCQSENSSSGAALIQPPSLDERRDVDLGVLQLGADMEHTFQVRNTAPQAISVISIEKTCTCQKLDLMVGTEIAADEVLAVPLTIPTKKIKGRQSGRITITTNSNEKELSRIVLYLTAEVPDSIRAIPPRVVFGVVNPGEATTHTLRIESEVPGLIEKFKGISSLQQATDVRLRESKAGQLNFEVALRPNLPVGDVQDTLRLEFDDENYPTMQVEVVGRKSGEFQVIPSKLVFPAFVGEMPLTRRMRIKAASGAVVKIEDISCPNNISVEPLPDQPQTGIDLLVTAKRPTDSQGNDSMVVLSTEDGKAINIPISYMQ